ncbi:MAG: metallophosphoesterase family protein [Candidatus Hodarchaeales archaeon]
MTIKLIALSDLHQGNPITPPNNIKVISQYKLIQNLITRKPRPDGILIAGDLQDYMWNEGLNPEDMSKMKKKLKKDRVFDALNKAQFPVIFVWGNTDILDFEKENAYQYGYDNTPRTDELRELFCEEFPNLRNCHRNIEFINDLPIFGYNDANKTIDPSGKCWEEPKILDDLQPLLKNLDVKERKKSIILTHTAPRGVLDFSSLGDKHIGSFFLREIIEDYQPLLSVFGHIHYCGGYSDFIGRTLCLNVSSFGLAVSHDILFGQSAFELEIDEDEGSILSTTMIVSNYFHRNQKRSFVEYRKCQACGRYTPFARRQFKICRVCLAARRIENKQVE